MQPSHPRGGRKLKSQAARTGEHCNMRDSTDPMVNSISTAKQHLSMQASMLEENRTDNDVQNPSPAATMVSEPKQETCDGYLDASVCNNDDPSVPP